MKSSQRQRRQRWGSGIVLLLLGCSLVLTACAEGQKQGGGPEHKIAVTQGGDVSTLVDYNPQPRDQLRQGGILTLGAGNLGPNFNTSSTAGNNISTSQVVGVQNTVGCWTQDSDGSVSLQKDYCESFTSATNEHGKQVLKITVNPKATWNDGKAIDIESFVNTWKMLRGEDQTINIVSPGAYKDIESVEQGRNAREIVVTMAAPSYPIRNLFGELLHPAINNAEVFNNGFVGKLHPEWAAGPFKLEQYDTAAKTISFVPNEKWWGNKPLLDQIVFRQMEASASIPAFRNKEIDAVAASTLNRYRQLEGSPDAQVRRGQRLFSGGLSINGKQAPTDDAAVRRAIWTAVDRAELAKVDFDGLNWEETLPGSMLLMPFSPYYQDNWPIQESGPEAAKKVLQDAGYVADGEGKMAKDGKRLAFPLLNFGDDPTTLALYQTLQKQLMAAGMDIRIDQRGQNDFGKVMGEGSYNLVIAGYTVDADATGAVQQFYDSRTNKSGLGSDELNARIDKLKTVENDVERNKEAMNVEKEHMAAFFEMGTIFNGPSISFVRSGLANFGPGLFRSSHWEDIGWEK